ncbi:hypothetical protein BG004_002909 [Podila humilis]|nr:hypothetical protein BG004_002909 [Podila humilis]
MRDTTIIMPKPMCFRFCIPDHRHNSALEAVHPMSSSLPSSGPFTSPGSTTENDAFFATDGTVWTCALTKLTDHTARVVLTPPKASTSTQSILANSENQRPYRKRGKLVQERPISSIQVISPSMQVLATKSVSRTDVYKRGIEFYIDQDDIFVNGQFEFLTLFSGHPVKHLHRDTLEVAQMAPTINHELEPMIELMTRFYLDSKTTNSHHQQQQQQQQQQQPIIRKRLAHQAILSIYPSFSEKLLYRSNMSPQTAAMQHSSSCNMLNPHRRTNLEFEEPVHRAWALEQMLKYMYTGCRPEHPPPPASAFPTASQYQNYYQHQQQQHPQQQQSGLGQEEQQSEWSAVFEVADTYGMESFMETYLDMFEEGMRVDRMLRLYFECGYYRYEGVVRRVARVLAEHRDLEFRGQRIVDYMLQVMEEMQQRGGPKTKEALNELSDRLFQR